MANRAWVDKNYTYVKRQVSIYGTVNVGAAGALTLQRWKYPTLGQGGTQPNAGAFVAATTGTTPSGAPWPLQYTQGAEGIRSITRTGVGGWQIALQDSFTRILGVNATIANANGLPGTVLTFGLVSTVTAGSQGNFTNLAAAGGSTVGITWVSGLGAAADPANGDIIYLELLMCDASEP